MRKIGGALALLVVAASTLAWPGATAAGAATTAQTLTVTPKADTYVASDAPAKSYGAAPYVNADGSPVKTGLVRFDVAGIGARTVANVRLRLYQVDNTKSGGRVLAMANAAWPEAVTWNTKPAVDGAQLAQFGAASKHQWYEVSLGAAAVQGDGAVSFAIANPGTDGSKWASRESGATAPQLLIDVTDPPPPPPPADLGLSTVVGPTIGSSDPTFFANQHRLVRTAGGRVLAVYGRHASGVEVAWRDGAGAWTSVPLLSDTGTGDWTASIALGAGSDGSQHAWVVWGGTAGFGEKPRPIQMRRLSNLDAATGPVVGPVVQVAEAGVAGNGRVDIALESATRGWVFWVHRTNTADTSSDHMIASFDGADTDAPVLNAPTSLFTLNTTSLATFADRSGTAGLRLLARTSTRNLTVYRHDPAAAVGGWTTGAAGLLVTTASRPAAAALPNGELLAAVESDTANDVVSVQRFAVDGTPKPVELTMTGYREPTIAVMKSGAAVVIAIRAVDGVIVSRTLTAGATTWSTADRVELGAEGGGNYQWPNTVRQGDGTLRFIVRGPSGGADQAAVLSVVRAL